jgi:plastocyanin
MNPVLFSRRSAQILGLAILAPAAWAASISAQVLDASGKPVSDAAVYAEPLTAQVSAKPPRTVDITQQGKKFAPLVTVVQTGTDISFPNNDTVRHHVYSFSPPKVFELKLYSGVPANPVRFDKPGTVVLGCNIHDRMVAYIHVVDTPYFGKTDSNGMIRLDGLAAGKYRLKAWHYNLAAGTPIPEQTVSVSGSDAAPPFRLDLKTGAEAG